MEKGKLYCIKEDLEDKELQEFVRDGIEKIESYLGKQAAFALWETEPGPNIPATQETSEESISDWPYWDKLAE